MSHWIYATVAVGMLAVVACSGEASPGFVDTPECESIERRAVEQPLREVRIGLVTGGVAVTIDAEVADDTGSRSRGLMCRSEVPSGTGMLFQFDGLNSGPFWMFNTYVPLDILYFDRSGSVVGSATMHPCPKERGESEGEWRSRCMGESTGYGPDGNYASALELPAGWLLTQGHALEQLPDDLRLVEFGPVNP
ncbi:MAG: DUF192 domain-containing protein [Chloroflexi bacterium]|nr:DUF192 domain-containing protein [Chloroflexota bacterium]